MRAFGFEGHFGGTQKTALTGEGDGLPGPKVDVNASGHAPRKALQPSTGRISSPPQPQPPSLGCCTDLQNCDVSPFSPGGAGGKGFSGPANPQLEP